MSSPDYDTMLVAELRQLLASAGLPTSGRKVELIERLLLNEQEPTMISIEADLVEENNSAKVFFTQMEETNNWTAQSWWSNSNWVISPDDFIGSCIATSMAWFWRRL